MKQLFFVAIFCIGHCHGNVHDYGAGGGYKVDKYGAQIEDQTKIPVCSGVQPKAIIKTDLIKSK